MAEEVGLQYTGVYRGWGVQWLEDWVTIQWKLYRDVAVWTCGCWGFCITIHGSVL